MKKTEMETELMPHISVQKCLLNLEKMSILPGVSSLYWSWHWCNMEPGRGSQLSHLSGRVAVRVGAAHRAGSGFLSSSNRIQRRTEWWEWNLW